jgi:hypothetical protein
MFIVALGIFAAALFATEPGVRYQLVPEQASRQSFLKIACNLDEAKRKQFIHALAYAKSRYYSEDIVIHWNMNHPVGVQEKNRLLGQAVHNQTANAIIKVMEKYEKKQNQYQEKYKNNVIEQFIRYTKNNRIVAIDTVYIDKLEERFTKPTTVELKGYTLVKSSVRMVFDSRSKVRLAAHFIKPKARNNLLDQETLEKAESLLKHGRLHKPVSEFLKTVKYRRVIFYLQRRSKTWNVTKTGFNGFVVFPYRMVKAAYEQDVANQCNK